MGHTDVSAIIPATAPTPFLPWPNSALWFSSPLLRARQTAEWLMDAYNIKRDSLHFAPDLKEQHFGNWEGRAYKDIDKEIFIDWSQPEKIQPEQGESFEQVCARVDHWLNAHLATNTGNSVVIIAHKGVIQAALRHALGITPRQVLSLSIDYASISHTIYHPQTLNGEVCYVNRLLEMQADHHP